MEGRGKGGMSFGGWDKRLKKLNIKIRIISKISIYNNST